MRPTRDLLRRRHFFIWRRSPNGNRTGRQEVHVMNADCSNVQQLTQHQGEQYAESPDWPSDGERITFDSNRDENQEIYIITADGSNLQRLTQHAKWDRMQ